MSHGVELLFRTLNDKNLKDMLCILKEKWNKSKKRVNKKIVFYIFILFLFNKIKLNKKLICAIMT